MIPELA